MSNRLERDIREWLDAERLGMDELAERSLAGALAELGRKSPGPGFVDRVIFATEPRPAPAVWHSRWLRAVIAVAIVAAGLAIVALPVLWLVADPLARAFGSPLAFAIPRLVVRTVARAVMTWHVIEDVAAALRVSLVSGPALALFAANVLVAATSLLGLKRLLKAPEEMTP